MLLPMYRNLDVMYNPERAAAVLNNSDLRVYMFADIMSMATFGAKMKVYKSK